MRGQNGIVGMNGRAANDAVRKRVKHFFHFTRLNIHDHIDSNDAASLGTTFGMQCLQ
jgi:hypothetical protein